MSSASYLHKHRRSPSFAKPDVAPPTPAEHTKQPIATTDFANITSLRQSPPPVNNLRIPTGAVISPPDSSDNSDGDETAAKRERGRELRNNWEELQEAVRSLPLRRESSPDKNVNASVQQTTSEPVSQTASPTGLSREARKISHSRSSTESKIVKPSYSESSVHTSDDSDDDDGLSIYKPALIRKKSGELVKPALRPTSRRRYSSMPGTPTYSKSVHFNDSDNQTRHFLQVDKPIAVSAGSSPVETYDSESEFPFEGNQPTVGTPGELEIKIQNFPEDSYERKTWPVRVERLYQSPDKDTLIGICAVHNIAYSKWVVARFTFDHWQTTSEVVSEFHFDEQNPPTDGCDRFKFHIKLSDQAKIESRTMLICVRYNVGHQEFWDNNYEKNYRIDFSRAETKPTPPRPVQSTGLGQRALSAIQRSRQSQSAQRGRQESIDDDFASRLDRSSGYHFGSYESFLGDSPTSIKLKPKPKRSTPLSASGPPSQPTNGLGSRYDFGTSLSAALSTAQDKLNRQPAPTHTNSTRLHTNTGYFGPLDRVGPSKPAAPVDRPDALTTDRPAMGSDQYKDLVQKFCYVGSTRSPNATKA